MFMLSAYRSLQFAFHSLVASTTNPRKHKYVTSLARPPDDSRARKLSLGPAPPRRTLSNSGQTVAQGLVRRVWDSGFGAWSLRA